MWKVYIFEVMLIAWTTTKKSKWCEIEKNDHFVGGNEPIHINDVIEIGAWKNGLWQITTS